MLTTRNLKPDTIIEITSTGDLGLLQKNSDSFDSNETPLSIGEQYKVISCKKHNSTSYSVQLEQLNGEKNGFIFISFLTKYAKIVQAVMVTKNENITASDLTLDEHEEYVLVHKNDPTLLFKSTYDLANHKNDVIIGTLLFNKQLSQRKKIKNLQSLNGILNSMSNVNNTNFFNQHNHNTLSEEAYHLISLRDIPYWVQGNESVDFNDVAQLELRKYDRDNKKIYDTPVNYDCYQKVINIMTSYNMTRQYGQAVSKVVSSLTTDEKENEYPFLLSAKFNRNTLDKLGRDSDAYKEKDVYFELALKEANYKKKDIYYYNNNSFVCIAFTNEEELKKFKSLYHNDEKEITIINTFDVINDPKVTVKKNPTFKP